MILLAGKYVLIGAIVFLPILLWGYIFSYLDNSSLNTRRFLAGIFAWALSVVPILYMNMLFTKLHLENFDIFALISSMEGSFIFAVIGCILLLLSIGLFVSSFSFAFFFQSFLKNIKTYGKNLLLMGSFALIFTIIWIVLKELPFFHSPTKAIVELAGLVFGTFASILLYYLMVGFVEEGTKHLSMAASSTELKTVQAGVLFSVFIALGFGFIENILYLNNISLNNSMLSSTFFTTWFFRSIFSLFVHVICSALVGAFFAQAWIMSEKKDFMKYLKTFLYGLFLAIAVHAIYDISLTFGFTGIIFVYFVFGYLWITRIFYKEGA